MHLHFFGRALEEVHQIRGQHMFLYPKDHPIYRGHLDPLDAGDVSSLRTRIAELLKEDKYRKLAELAEIG